VSQEAPTKTSLVEIRSIDYVPTTERHGKVAHLLPVWFQGNANLTTLVVGLLGPALGLNLAWTLVAIVLGLLVGTLFMAFHSAQGPKLGLPQMIQSRPQFGYYGSLLPVVVAVLLFIGFNVFNTIIGGQVVQSVTKAPFKVSAVLLAAVTLVFTYFGYDVIHKGLRWATYLFIAVYGVFTIGALVSSHLPAGQLTLGGGTFAWDLFLIQFGVVTSYQLTWAPYVSEYSRYLPEDTSTASTFWYTYIGCGLGGLWTMALGAFVIAQHPNLGMVDAMKAVGDDIFGGFGWILLLLSIPGLIAVIAMNMYSGGLSTLTTIDVIKPITPTLRARTISISFIAVVATALALILPESFLPDFQNFLFIVLYFMIPWTAVNLIDFFFVRKENYAILEMFKPHGIYGAWGWQGIAAYLAGFISMIPFFSTTLYTGAIATKLGGGDISPFIGFPVAAIVYYLLTRKLDVQKEWDMAAHERHVLEVEAGRHEKIGVPEDADLVAEAVSEGVMDPKDR
jgi:NCS1 family nucleobase:cation symporter-1